jgi:hypothetical protein
MQLISLLLFLITTQLRLCFAVIVLSVLTANMGGFDFVCQNELAILSVIQLYSAPAVTAIPKAVVMPAAIRCFIVIIV